jgi:uncharacterized damage-inducible protein DinB
MTHTQLAGELEKLEKKRADLFSKLATYDIETLNKKPGNEAWSAIQTIEHMLTVELAALSYVKKKSQDKAAAERTGLKQWFRSVLLNRYLRGSKKFPAPPSVVPISKRASLDEMQKQWNVIRQDMAKTISALPADLLGHGWFKHPAVGKLNLGQMLSFMEAHYDRHEKQVWRTLKEVA